MACASEEVMSSPVMVKLNKISSYLSSFQAENLSFKKHSLHLGNAANQPEENRTILSEHQNEIVTTSPSLANNKLNVYYCTDVPVASKQSLNNFRCRLKTFGDVCWMLPTNLVSVYECVRRGWYLLQQDMLCCCSCNEMLCLQLPPSHSSSYKHAVSILRDRVLNKHKGNCRYRSYAEPVAVSRPPSLLTTPHLYSLAAAAHKLASGASPTSDGVHLPYLENGGSTAMDRLGVSPLLLQEVWGSVCDNAWQHVAVLLVLCGWKGTTAPDTIRCELCQRSIGLWHFLSYAEHQDRETAVAASVLSELEQHTPETTDTSSEAGPDGTSDKSEAAMKATGTISQNPEEEESNVATSGDELVAANTERSEVSENTEEGRRLADDIRPENAAAASRDPIPNAEENSDCNSGQKSISNKDEPNNITDSSSVPNEIGTGNKRKRSECDNGSNDEDQSKLVLEAGDESTEALASKRSKSDEVNQTSDTREAQSASSGVSVEESSPAVAQVPSKPLFCPLSQHRYWCGWVTSQKEHLASTGESVAFLTGSSDGAAGNRLQPQDTSSEARGDITGTVDNIPLDTLLGYEAFARQLKSVLQLAQRKQWTASDKYAKTIDGLRSVRAHLTSWAK